MPLLIKYKLSSVFPYFVSTSFAFNLISCILSSSRANSSSGNPWLLSFFYKFFKSFEFSAVHLHILYIGTARYKKITSAVQRLIGIFCFDL